MLLMRVWSAATECSLHVLSGLLPGYSYHSRQWQGVYTRWPVTSTQPFCTSQLRSCFLCNCKVFMVNIAGPLIHYSNTNSTLVCISFPSCGHLHSGWDIQCLPKLWEQLSEFFAIYWRHFDLRSKDECEAKVQTSSFYFMVFTCVYVLPFYRNSCCCIEAKQ